MSEPLLTEALPGFRAWRDRRRRAGCGRPPRRGRRGSRASTSPAAATATGTTRRPAAACAACTRSTTCTGSSGRSRWSAGSPRGATWRCTATASAPGAPACSRSPTTDAPLRERRRCGGPRERYGVPLVPRDALAPVVAERCGLLPASVIAGGDQAWLARRRGYDAEQQLWVEPGGGAVTVGVSDALLAWLGGDAVAVLDGDGFLRAAGRRRDRRPAPRDPRAGGRPRTASSRATGSRTAWRSTGARRGGRPTSAARARAAAGFAHLLESGAFDRSAVTCWADVQRALRGEDREAVPSFASDRELYDELGIALGARPRGRHRPPRPPRPDARPRRPRAGRAAGAATCGSRGVHLRCGPGGGARPDVTVDVAGDDLPAAVRRCGSTSRRRRGRGGSACTARARGR